MEIHSSDSHRTLPLQEEAPPLTAQPALPAAKAASKAKGVWDVGRWALAFLG